MTEYLVESKPAPILGRPPKLRGHENKEKKKKPTACTQLAQHLQSNPDIHWAAEGIGK